MEPLIPSVAPETGQRSVLRAQKNEAAAPLGFEVLLALLAPAAPVAVVAPQGVTVTSDRPGASQPAAVLQSLAPQEPAVPARTTALSSAAAVEDTTTRQPAAAPGRPLSIEASLPQGMAAELRAALSAEELRALQGQPVSVTLRHSDKRAAFAPARGAESAWLANLAEERPEAAPLQQAPTAKTGTPADQKASADLPLELAPAAAKGQQNAQAASMEAGERRPLQVPKALSDAALRSSQKETATPPPPTAAPPAPPQVPMVPSAYEAQLRAVPQALLVPEQVALALTKALDGERDRITIKLHPSELGRVHIKLDLGQDGTVRVVVAADRPETLELLQRDARGLERALEQAGLRADSGGLSFDLGGGSRHLPDHDETAASTPPLPLENLAEETLQPVSRGERRHDGLVSISA